MQKMIMLCGLLVVAFFGHTQSPAEEFSERLALKLKDSLQLNELQKNQLYQINLNLHNQKQLVWQKHSQLDSVRYHLQQIENMRDSAYKSSLSTQEYELYIQRKKNLLSKN